MPILAIEKSINMKNTIQNQEAYEKAKSRATAKAGFYLHLIVFAAVLLLLLVINRNYSA